MLHEVNMRYLFTASKQHKVKKRCVGSKRCSLHRSTNHSDAECCKQQAAHQQPAASIAQANTASANQQTAATTAKANAASAYQEPGVATGASTNQHTATSLALTNVPHVGTNFLPADSGQPYPTFGFSFAAGGSSSTPAVAVRPAGTAAASADPAPSGIPSNVRLGASAEQSRSDPDSPCRLFGAFGVCRDGGV